MGTSLLLRLKFFIRKVPKLKKIAVSVQVSLSYLSDLLIYYLYTGTSLYPSHLYLNLPLD